MEHDSLGHLHLVHDDLEIWVYDTRHTGTGDFMKLIFLMKVMTLMCTLYFKIL
jgi:hypothetical protein